MAVENLNFEIWDAVSEVNSNDPAFLDIRKKLDDYRMSNMEYFDLQKDMAAGKKLIDYSGKELAKGDVEYILKPAYFANNIRLRNELNKYLENNRDKMTNKDYQAVLKAYEKVVEKCEEDVKEFGETAYFDSLMTTYEKEITHNKGQINAEMLGRNMAAKYYVASLKKEYNAALKLIEDGNEQEKADALKWKEEVIASLYSGKFDENLDNFIKENPVGNKVYEYYKSRYDAENFMDGISYDLLKIMDQNLNSELMKYKMEKMDEIIALKTTEDSGASKEEIEANKQKGLDLVSQIEEMVDICKIAAMGKSAVADFDAYDIIVSKELIAPFKDTLEPVRKKLEEEYIENSRNEVNKQIADYEKTVKEVATKKAIADSEFNKALKELEAGQVRFDKAKANYEKVKSIGFVDEDDRIANESIFKHQQEEYEALSAKHGDAASKASRLSRELEKMEQQLQQMKANRDNVLREKVKNSPYKTHPMTIVERQIKKEVNMDLGDGQIGKNYVVDTPANIKINRTLKMLKYLQTGKVTAEEYRDFMAKEEENFQNNLKAQKRQPVKKTVNPGIEPGAAALDIRNRQLSGELNQKEPEQPVPEDINNIDNVENINEVENEELDINNIEIIKEARAEKAALEVEVKENPSYEEAHKNLIDMGILVAALKAADKGVFNGSKEYDDIVKNLQNFKEIEDYQNQNAENFDPAELEANRQTMLQAKKLLAVEMKHYLKRKNDEKDAAQREGGTERKNSKVRRETMGEVLAIFEEHIQADEIAFGTANQDKTYENAVFELKYLSMNNKKVKGLNELSNMMSAFVESMPETLTSDERLKTVTTILNGLTKVAAKNKDNARLQKDVLEVYENMSNCFLLDVAENKPDHLPDLIDTFKKNNELFGTRVDTNVLPVEKNANSYDDIINHQSRLMKDYAKHIFNEEKKTKEFSEEWALYNDPAGDKTYDFSLSENEKNVAKKMVKSAYKIILADDMKNNGIIFDQETLENKYNELNNKMKSYKSFNSKFAKNLCKGFDLNGKELTGENAYTVDSVDLSLDTIKEIKNDTFRDMLVDKLGALANSIKQKEDKADIMKNLFDVNEMGDIAKLIGAEDVYNSKIKVDDKEITLKQLDTMVKQKAEKALEEPKAEIKKDAPNDQKKQEVKPNNFKK